MFLTVRSPAYDHSDVSESEDEDSDSCICTIM